MKLDLQDAEILHISLNDEDFDENVPAWQTIAEWADKNDPTVRTPAGSLNAALLSTFWRRPLDSYPFPNPGFIKVEYKIGDSPSATANIPWYLMVTEDFTGFKTACPISSTAFTSSFSSSSFLYCR